MDGSYRDISCCNNTRNIDNTLSKYVRERDHIIKTLSKYPSELVDKIWSIDGYLSNDPACMCHAGKHKKYTSYTCPPCINMGRIIDYDSEKIGRPFLVECGEKVGHTFVLITLPVGHIGLDTGNNDKSQAKKFLEEHQNMLKCGTQEIDGLTFIKSDTFTNNILIWWIIDKIFQNKGLPYALPLHTAYICRRRGFLLSNSPTIGNYEQLKQVAITKEWDRYDTCLSICKQLGVILDVLHKYFFSHGNPHTDMLLFSDEDNEHQYGDVLISSNFIMHVIDFNYSSITCEKTRLYPKTERNDILFNHCMLQIDIKDGKYYLTNKSDILFNYIRHAGLPIYSSSFDFYCFIVCLMLDSYFYDSVVKDARLYNAWESIWTPADLDVIESRIKKNKDKDVDTVRLLERLWLQCDVVKTWLSNL